MLRRLWIALLCLGCSGEVAAPVRGSLVYIRDREGSVVAAVDDLGQVLRSSDTDGFGLALSSTGTPVPRAFLDKEVDEETGYLVFPTRLYDPATAQWLSPDPRLLATLDCSRRVQDCNPYAFAGDRPLDWTDQDGREALSFFDDKGRATGQWTLAFYGPDAEQARANTLAMVRAYKGPIRIVVFTAIYKNKVDVPHGATGVDADAKLLRSTDLTHASYTDPDLGTIHLLGNALTLPSGTERTDEVLHELLHTLGIREEGYERKGGLVLSLPGHESGIMGNYHTDPEGTHLTLTEFNEVMNPPERGEANPGTDNDPSLLANPTFEQASSGDPTPAPAK